MKCAHYREVDSECAECGQSVARVENAARLLRSEPLPAYSAQKRAELLIRLSEDRRSPWIYLGPIAAAAIIAAVLVAWPKGQVSMRTEVAELQASSTGTEPAPLQKIEPQRSLSLEPTADPMLSELRSAPEPQLLEPSFPAASKAKKEPARRLAGTADRAAIEKKPAELEVKELLSLADQQRRQGEWSAAAEAYARVAEHSQGASYAEEALLRRAQILAAHELVDGALAALSAAEQRSSQGTLATERAVLEAQLYLRRSEVVRAAEAIERTGNEQTPAALRARLEVAEALFASAPARAKELVQPVLASKASAELLERARLIDSRAGGNE